MTIEDALTQRVQSAAEQLRSCGLVGLLAPLIRDVWATNVARSDTRLGDTVRLLGITSAENLAARLSWLRTQPEWAETHVEIKFEQNSMLITSGDLRIHIMKAPQSSRRQPDWHHDFPWANQSNVRADSARNVDETYRAPAEIIGMEPMFPADGLGEYGDPADIREFFVVWAGEFSEDPLTAGWVVIPTLKKMQVLAYEQLWFDEAGGGAASRTPNQPQSAPAGDLEPEVKITIKTAPRQTGETRAR
jgi:hypothetical protein